MSAPFQSTPSIARNIEATVASVPLEGGRFHVRFDVRSDHQVYVDEAGALSGIFVVTAEPLALGADVSLLLELPWGETMEALGTVAWLLEVPRVSLRHRPGMGVKFELPPQLVALLERTMLLREPMRIPEGVRRGAP